MYVPTIFATAFLRTPFTADDGRSIVVDVRGLGCRPTVNFWLKYNCYLTDYAEEFDFNIEQAV